MVSSAFGHLVITFITIVNHHHQQWWFTTIIKNLWRRHCDGTGSSEQANSAQPSQPSCPIRWALQSDFGNLVKYIWPIDDDMYPYVLSASTIMHLDAMLCSLIFATWWKEYTSPSDGTYCLCLRLGDSALPILGNHHRSYTCQYLTSNHVIPTIVTSSRTVPLLCLCLKQAKELISVQVWKLFYTWQSSGRRPQSREPRWLPTSKWQWHRSWGSIVFRLSPVGIGE